MGEREVWQGIEKSVQQEKRMVMMTSFFLTNTHCDNTILTFFSAFRLPTLVFDLPSRED